MTAEAHSPNDRKRYNLLKLAVSLTETLLLIGLIMTLLLTGWSRDLAGWAGAVSANSYVHCVTFAALFGFVESLLTWPLHFFGGFYLEHRYGMSNQTFIQWLLENLKGMGISAVIGLPLLLIFYFGLLTFLDDWWLPVAAAFFVFSVVLARLAPTLIFPLFYDFKPLMNEALQKRLLQLCSDVKLNVSGIFEFNMSKTTKKANAAFAGIGRSKRILLADTLLENFSDEEIEVVFAHEVGHYYHRHIVKSVWVSLAAIFGGLYVTALLYRILLPVFHFSDITDLAALPLLVLLLILFGAVTGPATNALSRAFERQADAYALRKTRNRSGFIRAMRRLSEMNLADDAPHPAVEFLFYSHPAISRRIKAAENFILPAAEG